MRHTLLSLVIGTFLIGCTQSPEETVLAAVKDYRLNNTSIDEAMQVEVRRLEAEGREVAYHWDLKKLSETEYEFTTTIEAARTGKKKSMAQRYQWLASKNMVKSKGLRSEVWNLKAKNKLARMVIRRISSAKFARMARKIR